LQQSEAVFLQLDCCTLLPYHLLSNDLPVIAAKGAQRLWFAACQFLKPSAREIAGPFGRKFRLVRIFVGGSVMVRQYLDVFGLRRTEACAGLTFYGIVVSGLAVHMKWLQILLLRWLQQKRHANEMITSTTKAIFQQCQPKTQKNVSKCCPCAGL